jgi:hypothetical protein
MLEAVLGRALLSSTQISGRDVGQGGALLAGDPHGCVGVGQGCLHGHPAAGGHITEGNPIGGARALAPVELCRAWRPQIEVAVPALQALLPRYVNHVGKGAERLRAEGKVPIIEFNLILCGVSVVACCEIKCGLVAGTLVDKKGAWLLFQDEVGSIEPSHSARVPL